VFFLVLNVTLYAHSYSEMLIKAQATIFPNILLLDKKLNNKLIENKIIFIIACENDDLQTAVEIKNILHSRYKNFLSNYLFETKILEFSQITENTNATAIYALHSNTNLNKLSKIALKKGIITFAYDINDLNNGIMFSLMLEKNTVIYLNKENLNNNTTDFIDSFYEIIKFIHIQK
jgi:hypothetical protein